MSSLGRTGVGCLCLTSYWLVTQLEASCRGRQLEARPRPSW